MSREEREARHAVRTAINAMLGAIERHGAEARLIRDGARALAKEAKR